MVLSGKPELDREAIESVLSQTGVDLELVLVESRGRRNLAPSIDTRVRNLRASRPPSRLRLLQRLAQESAAPFILCLDPEQQLLPGALASVLADMQNDQSIEMMYALQFPADESGHVSRPGYHLQWEQARGLQAMDVTRVQSFLTLDFLPGNIRIYRRQALLEKVFRRPKPYSTYGFIWSVHCLLNAKLKSDPVCIIKGSQAVTASKQ